MGAHKSKHRSTGSKSLEAKKQMLLQNVLAVEKEIKESKQDIQDASNDVKGETKAESKNERELQDFKHMKVNDVSWPDPDPKAGEGYIQVDDVTRLNMDKVRRIIFVRCIEDIQYGGCQEKCQLSPTSSASLQSIS